MAPRARKSEPRTTTSPPPAQKTEADWFYVEKEFRAGIRPLRDIASDAGITEGAIRKRAKRDHWERNLQAKIQAKADDKVRKAAVRKPTPETPARTQLTPADEETVVDANAELQFQVRINHRRGLGKLREIKEKLLTQIETVVDAFPDLHEVIELVRKPDEKGADKANDQLRKAMDRSTVVDDLKKLAEIDEKVRKGEREAFGIIDEPTGKTPTDAATEFLNYLSARGSRLPIAGGQA